MDHIQAWDKYGSMTYDDLPDHVVQVANQCILDWFGCAIAGSAEPLSEILRNQFGHRKGSCSVIGSDLKLDAATAALLNGASGHALDYDDTGSRTGCHSTAPVLPAVLAVAEETGAASAMRWGATTIQEDGTPPRLTARLAQRPGLPIC
jgi:2-methylcitrate dehydratase PrpD